jgi:hypothetical protein
MPPRLALKHPNLVRGGRNAKGQSATSFVDELDRSARSFAHVEVQARLFLHEQACIVAAFAGADFENDVHVALLSLCGAMRQPRFDEAGIARGSANGRRQPPKSVEEGRKADAPMPCRLETGELEGDWRSAFIIRSFG